MDQNENKLKNIEIKQNKINDIIIMFEVIMTI